MASLNQLQTVALVVIGSALLLSVWTWASETVGEQKQVSTENKQTAITCSSLEINQVDTLHNETHTTVFFSTNTDVDALRVRFYGNGTREVNVTDVSQQSLNEVSVALPEAEAEIYAPSCRQP
ncbi:hypothetical protein [Candidatus Nanohalococcus occultus]|uniref:Uncharacterized protein n=1 Tax=Candidatus Nanohalococcus occultus TaxID=2978047 RepID=A0ABY8CGJ1_9ARCH|nr:hypothetical protein SVXNc_0123 [Candidatus Nanohaloarchaeota archaeon SVXNc]